MIGDAPESRTRRGERERETETETETETEFQFHNTGSPGFVNTEFAARSIQISATHFSYVKTRALFFCWILASFDQGGFLCSIQE